MNGMKQQNVDKVEKVKAQAMLWNVRKRNKFLLKMPVLLQTARAVETLLADGLTLKLWFTRNVE